MYVQIRTRDGVSSYTYFDADEEALPFEIDGVPFDAFGLGVTLTVDDAARIVRELAASWLPERDRRTLAVALRAALRSLERRSRRDRKAE